MRMRVLALMCWRSVLQAYAGRVALCRAEELLHLEHVRLRKPAHPHTTCIRLHPRRLVTYTNARLLHSPFRLCKRAKKKQAYRCGKECTGLSCWMPALDDETSVVLARLRTCLIHMIYTADV